jgi:hypothetical protein
VGHLVSDDEVAVRGVALLVEPEVFRAHRARLGLECEEQVVVIVDDPPGGAEGIGPERRAEQGDHLVLSRQRRVDLGPQPTGDGRVDGVMRSPPSQPTHPP